MADNTDPTRGWVWNAEAQDHYRQEWDGENWITYWSRQLVPPPTPPQKRQFKGCDVLNKMCRRRRDSLADSVPSELPTEAIGETIRGDPVAVQGDTEPLDPSYIIQTHPRRFFTTGRMFSVLHTEPLGVTAPRRPVDNVSTVMYGERVYSQIRRFIVVKEGRGGFCYACPVSTYGGRGTSKPGLNPQTHAIVYTIPSTPNHVPGEGVFEKYPIAIVPADETVFLTAASRINFAIHHPIQHNVKVKNLGMVHSDCIPNLIYYARMESGW